MSIFTYHLVKKHLFGTLKSILFPIKSSNIDGLIHAETMAVMELGAPVFSVSRFFVGSIAIFAQWESQKALNQFLTTHPKGKSLLKSWYVELKFVRQWGKISGYKIPSYYQKIDDNQIVVAVTMAKMKHKEIPRFLRWGRPVEKLVRDHSGITLVSASIRLPNLISTFSIWKSQKQMNDMVYGYSKEPKNQLHKKAMEENIRKEFHFEFTTLRFIPINEYGSWNGKSNFILKEK